MSIKMCGKKSGQNQGAVSICKLVQERTDYSYETRDSFYNVSCFLIG